VRWGCPGLLARRRHWPTDSFRNRTARPPGERLLERPFIRIRGRAPSGSGSAFVLGLGSVRSSYRAPDQYSPPSRYWRASPRKFLQSPSKPLLRSRAALPLFAIASRVTIDREESSPFPAGEKATTRRGVLLILMALASSSTPSTGFRNSYPVTRTRSNNTSKATSSPTNNYEVSVRARTTMALSPRARVLPRPSP